MSTKLPIQIGTSAPVNDTVIKSGDHVIVFVVDKEKTKAVEKLFSVGFSDGNDRTLSTA